LTTASDRAAQASKGKTFTIKTMVQESQSPFRRVI
jgi:hypothetical protein